MDQNQQTSSGQEQQTGTRNDTYDVISVVYHALQGAETCQKYLRDAQEEQLRKFFEQAQEAQRQLAELGKQIFEPVPAEYARRQCVWLRSVEPG